MQIFRLAATCYTARRGPLVPQALIGRLAPWIASSVLAVELTKFGQFESVCEGYTVGPCLPIF